VIRPLIAGIGRFFQPHGRRPPRRFSRKACMRERRAGRTICATWLPHSVAGRIIAGMFLLSRRRALLRFLCRLSRVRVAVLSLILIGASTIAAWNMVVPAARAMPADTASVHHDCDAPTMPGPHEQAAPHGTCPCSHAGCLCVHACSVDVPAASVLPSIPPVPVHIVRHSPTPGPPPPAELLRPPIA